MNVTGMPVQVLLRGQSISHKKIPSELSHVFQDLLVKTKIPEQKTSNQLNSQNPKELLNVLLGSLPKEVEEQLGQLVKELDDTSELVENLNLDEPIIIQLKEILRDLTEPASNDLFQKVTPVVTSNISATVVPISKKEIQQQLVEVSMKAESLLSGVTNHRSIEKIAPEIQQLLGEWNKILKKLTDPTERTGKLRNPDTKKSTKSESIWRELVSIYQKRNQFVTSQHYDSNAKVTSSDVKKWIGKALFKSDLDTVPATQVGHSSMLMSKVEQYVINLNQSQSTHYAGQQLVDKFQEIMNSSKFISMNNGSTQLSIALRPANLGEMMVRLTQINGEMTVKIIVASAAAQDMLESNIQQLKRAFAPQNVLIEKQDLNSQVQNMQQEKNQQSMHDNDQTESEHSDQDENNQANDDFEKQFHEILMNEKV